MGGPIAFANMIHLIFMASGYQSTGYNRWTDIEMSYIEGGPKNRTIFWSA